MSKLTAQFGPLSIEYKLPTGETVAIAFEDRFDTRLQPRIDFQLKSGEIVLALMKVTPEQCELLELLALNSGSPLELTTEQIPVAYELHQRNLATFGRGYAWITFNGRKLLSRLP